MKLQHCLTIGCAAVLIGCNSSSSRSNPSPPPPPDTPVTVNFEITDFNSVSMDASFDYSIRQGNEYLVEITIDSSYAADLDVFLEGSTLNVGFEPGNDIRAETLEAVIVLPDVNRIELSGSVHGTVAGFSGNTLEIALRGSPVVEGVNLDYSYVAIDSNGSGSADLSDVVAIPAADVQLNGSGTATLNLMDFATVTGSLAGTTSLNYYGSGINLQVSTSNGASITRLGGTR